VAAGDHRFRVGIHPDMLYLATWGIATEQVMEWHLRTLIAGTWDARLSLD
jgi:hypothetical protein